MNKTLSVQTVTMPPRPPPDPRLYGHWQVQSRLNEEAAEREKSGQSKKKGKGGGQPGQSRGDFARLRAGIEETMFPDRALKRKEKGDGKGSTSAAGASSSGNQDSTMGNQDSPIGGDWQTVAVSNISTEGMSGERWTITDESTEGWSSRKLYTLTEDSYYDQKWPGWR